MSPEETLCRGFASSPAKSPPFPRPTGTNLRQSAGSRSGHMRASSGGPHPQGGRNTMHLWGAGGAAV